MAKNIIDKLNIPIIKPMVYGELRYIPSPAVILNLLPENTPKSTMTKNIG
ncbi:hypothetical protein [Hwangdonia lutea]|uniref:Uncharacterized protein n=1 Tax=Hwangdonia lutea TaxID=3075823 RepID=A0AA97ELQ7_9FLAO|nr:hypothetical protein [Hwangdonia sp. SCSIO 19198]WOD43572.1 hypothetical protein RNZ46_16405 [Hwangdonia sp. SCSIO 19198]